MKTGAEGEVGGSAARDVELVGMSEAVGVSVCGDDSENDAFAFADFNSVDNDIGCCGSRKSSNETGIAKQFLDCLFGEFGLLVQEIPLLRMLDQGEPSVSEQAGHGLRERDEGGVAHGRRPSVEALAKADVCRLRSGAEC